MLVDQHTNRDARHIKSVKKVLYAVVGLLVHRVGLLELHDALRHRLHHIGVTIAYPDQSLTKPVERGGADVGPLEGDDLGEGPRVPVRHQDDGRHPGQVLRQQRDLLHDVGQPDGQLLAQEGERLALARLVAEIHELLYGQRRGVKL